MEYLNSILPEKEIPEFLNLVQKSMWMSNLEKDLFLGKAESPPPLYLVEAAFAAVREENEFFVKMQDKRPDFYQYLLQMQEWLDRDDKLVSNFPGFPDLFEEDLLKDMFGIPSESENHESENDLDLLYGFEIPSESENHESENDLTFDWIDNLSELENDESENDLDLLYGFEIFSESKNDESENDLDLHGIIFEPMDSENEEEKSSEELEENNPSNREKNFQETEDSPKEFEKIFDQKEKGKKEKSDPVNNEVEVREVKTKQKDSEKKRNPMLIYPEHVPEPLTLKQFMDLLDFFVGGVPETGKTIGQLEMTPLDLEKDYLEEPSKHFLEVDWKNFLLLLRNSLLFGHEQKGGILLFVSSFSSDAGKYLFKKLAEEQKKLLELDQKYLVPLQIIQEACLANWRDVIAKIKKAKERKKQRNIWEKIQSYLLRISKYKRIKYENIEIRENFLVFMGIQRELSLEEFHSTTLVSSNNLYYVKGNKWDEKIMLKILSNSSSLLGKKIVVLEEELGEEFEDSQSFITKMQKTLKDLDDSEQKLEDWVKKNLSSFYREVCSGIYSFESVIAGAFNSVLWDILLPFSSAIGELEMEELEDELDLPIVGDSFYKMLRSLFPEKEKSIFYTKNRWDVLTLSLQWDYFRKQKKDYLEFFNQILQIENFFQCSQFEKGKSFVLEALNESPHFLFWYEYYFQLLKIEGHLNIKAVKEILNDRYKEFPQDLYMVLCLFLDFEEIYLYGEKRFLEKIYRFSFPRKFLFVKSYLLSKFFVFFHDRNFFLDESLAYCQEALLTVSNEDIESQIFLYHFQIKILFLLKDFSSIKILVENIFEGSNVPLYYQYIILFQSLTDKVRGDMEYFEEKQVQYFLKNYLLTAPLKSDIHQNLHFSFLNFLELDESQVNLNWWWKILWEMKEIVEKLYFSDDQFLLPHFSEALELQNFYNKGREYRYKVRNLLPTFMKKYYFLSIGYQYFFKNEHYQFTQDKFSFLIEKTMGLLLFCGFSDNIFELYADCYHWVGWYQKSFRFDLLDGMICKGDFGTSILCCLKKHWFTSALMFLILGLSRNSQSSNLFNCFSIGLPKGLSFQILSVSFSVKSMNMDKNLSATYLGNRSSNFVLQRKKVNLFLFPQNTFYNSLMMLWITPHYTWNSYSPLLGISEKLQKEEFFLTTYYAGLYYDSPEIKNKHKKNAFHIVNNALKRKKESSNFSYNVLLAKSIIENQAYWVEKENLLDSEAVAFDFLQKAEKLLENNDYSVFFLGEYAMQVFFSLASQPWYLYYRFPEKNYEEKYQKRLETLRELELLVPPGKETINFAEISNEKSIRKFITSLNSGRILHIPEQTIQKVWSTALNIFEKQLSLLQSQEEWLKNGKVREIAVKDKLIEKFLPEKIPSQKKEGSLLKKIKKDFSFLLSQETSFFQEISPQEEFDEFLLRYQIPVPNKKISFKDFLEGDFDTLGSIYKERKEISRKIVEIKQETIRELFFLVRQHHVLHGSEMFESFRKRIRHGWLIASLKDCFSQHSLYMDGEGEVISPEFEGILSGLEEEKAKEEIKDKIVALKENFNAIVQRLDQQVLWLLDEDHPEGLLDYSEKHFPLEKLIQEYFSSGFVRKESLDSLLRHLCQMLDERTLSNFESIKQYLEKQVFSPLNSQLRELQRIVQHWKKAFRSIPQEHPKLLARLDDAAQEFEKNIKIYQSWFAFYQSAVRDFTLPELFQAAEKLVWDLEHTQIQEKSIQKAEIQFDQGIEEWYFLGENFPDFLEILKVLFQNVVYHSYVEEDQKPIHTRIEGTLEINQKIPTFRFTFISTHEKEVPQLDQIWEKVKQEEKRKEVLLKKRGTGLSSIEDILLNHLKGASGQIEKIEWDSIHEQFRFVFSVTLEKPGSPSQSKKEETIKTAPLNQLLVKVKESQGLRVLIVEDQKPKFDALRDYISSLWGGSHITHTWDIETTCRLLLESKGIFDFVLLDMTLPEDPSYDSPLASLAGLVILKVMQDYRIYTPTVVMTQYSNWSAEKAQNTKVFIDTLNDLGQEKYGAFFQGTIRFSHTELTWQNKLEEIMEAMLEKNNKLQVKILDAKRQTVDRRKQELYQKEMMAALGQITATLAHEFNSPLQAIGSSAEFIELFDNRDQLSSKLLRENLKIILQSVETISSRVKHVQSLVKGDLDKLERVNLNSLIDRSFELFEKQLQIYDIHITREFHSDLPPISGNPLRLEQALQNLITNARDALEEVKNRKREIVIQTQVIYGQTPVVRLLFRDNGIGFQEVDNPSKIFQMGFTTKPPGKGMGFGLSIVQGIISEFGGTIRVEESDPGVAFRIEFPAAEKEEE